MSDTPKSPLQAQDAPPPEHVLRTPPERFAGLPDYPFAPNYRYLGDGLRLHYVDEGPQDSRHTVLMMHGEPSWSYLYRHMIPAVAERARVIAPDLIGFGRSDKPARQSDYTYARHVAWMSEWFELMDLNDVVLVCQDWGGLIGLRLVAAYPERFSAVVAANTMLPVGNDDHPPPEAFLRWQAHSQTATEFPVGTFIQSSTTRTLSPEEVAAYDAPFPTDAHKAGARIFPALVPTRSDDPENAAQKAAWKTLSEFGKPFVTAFSDSDPITAGGDAIFQSRIPGTKNQPHTTLTGGHHFLQEDVPAEFAAVVLGVLDRLDT